MIFFFFLKQYTCFSLWHKEKRILDRTGLPYLPDCKIIYYENFSDPNVLDYWIPTSYPGYNGTWKAEQLYQLQTRRGERGLVMKGREKSHGISHKFRHPISLPPNETFILQYEARSQFHFRCTSAFIKLLTADYKPQAFSNSTEHIIEFGPERCWDFNQTRFTVITYQEDPETHQKTKIEHKMKHSHWIPNDEVTHLFTLIIRPNNTFEYLIDNRSMRNGTFIDAFDPPIFNMPSIDDPTDVKPSDWDDRILIPDPNAKKPLDWDDNAPEEIPDPKRKNPPNDWLLDEPLTIINPKAKKPQNWDEDKLGEWKPPEIPNPKCSRARVKGCGPYIQPKIRNPKFRGVWKTHWINNPDYKGEWKPRQIKNPNYKGETNFNFSLPPITGLAFDVWAEFPEFAFSNIMIATDETAIRKWNAEDFIIRQRKQIQAMRISYHWLKADDPTDFPVPGFVGHVQYYGRQVKKQWNKVENKPAVITIAIAIIMITIPLSIIAWAIFVDDDNHDHYD